MRRRERVGVPRRWWAAHPWCGWVVRSGRSRRYIASVCVCGSARRCTPWRWIHNIAVVRVVYCQKSRNKVCQNSTHWWF